MHEAPGDPPKTTGAATPAAPVPAADDERILLLECRLEQLRSAIDEARADADRVRAKLAEAAAREADHARRYSLVRQELAEARAELGSLHERLSRSEALRAELEGHLFETGARGDAAELVRLRRELLAQRERSLINERTSTRLRARVDELLLSRETLLTRVAEWQRLVRKDEPGAVDLAEFIAELRRDILHLEQRNAIGERQEAALRERLVRAGVDPEAPPGEGQAAPQGVDQPAPVDEAGPDARRGEDRRTRVDKAAGGAGGRRVLRPATPLEAGGHYAGDHHAGEDRAGEDRVGEDRVGERLDAGPSVAAVGRHGAGTFGLAPDGAADEAETAAVLGENRSAAVADAGDAGAFDAAPPRAGAEDPSTDRLEIAAPVATGRVEPAGSGGSSPSDGSAGSGGSGRSGDSAGPGRAGGSADSAASTGSTGSIGQAVPPAPPAPTGAVGAGEPQPVEAVAVPATDTRPNPTARTVGEPEGVTAAGSGEPIVAEAEVPAAAESGGSKAADAEVPNTAGSGEPSAADAEVPSTGESGEPSVAEAEVPSTGASGEPIAGEAGVSTTAEPGEPVAAEAEVTPAPDAEAPSAAAASDEPTAAVRIETPVDGLDAPDPAVRAAAYERLTRVLEGDPSRLGDHLRAGLADPHPRVRRRAVLAAATARRLALHPLLDPLRGDPDPQVRRVVREVLRRAPPAQLRADDRERTVRASVRPRIEAPS